MSEIEEYICGTCNQIQILEKTVLQKNDGWHGNYLYKNGQLVMFECVDCGTITEVEVKK